MAHLLADSDGRQSPTSHSCRSCRKFALIQLSSSCYIKDALLNYLSLAPRPYYRFERALRKIASFRIGMDKLLDMEFHTRVLNKLSNTPCRILRFFLFFSKYSLFRNARRCVRCEKCATCSRDILREFSQQVDSDFGHSFVNRLVSSPNFMTRTIGAIAKVTLTKYALYPDLLRFFFGIEAD